MKCGAKTRSGDPCKLPPVTGRNRCRMHGGKSLAGVASPTYVHGQRSRYALKGALSERYLSALPDLDYLNSRDEIAIATGLIQGLLEKTDDPTAYPDIVDLLDARRRLVDTEIKRVKLAQDTLTREQAKAFGAAVLESLRRHVRDATVIQAVQDDVLRALSTVAAAA